jgi:hypothetical protein
MIEITIEKKIHRLAETEFSILQIGKYFFADYGMCRLIPINKANPRKPHKNNLSPTVRIARKSQSLHYIIRLPS